MPLIIFSHVLLLIPGMNFLQTSSYVAEAKSLSVFYPKEVVKHGTVLLERVLVSPLLSLKMYCNELPLDSSNFA